MQTRLRLVLVLLGPLVQVQVQVQVGVGVGVELGDAGIGGDWCTPRRFVVGDS